MRSPIYSEFVSFSIKIDQEKALDLDLVSSHPDLGHGILLIEVVFAFFLCF